ncbi:hypothetical protein PVAP13_8KG173103 [Panicum virgatum]|uniref:Uncharacterized protein n=1 Tax=Panicum virgatum TaxID=38727 RepID=A0A8T0PLR2_PANVG|nr:hypothetical protein PVAP13_8KG173103 [Panicum virgatum]
MQNPPLKQLKQLLNRPGVQPKNLHQTIRCQSQDLLEKFQMPVHRPMFLRLFPSNRLMHLITIQQTPVPSSANELQTMDTGSIPFSIFLLFMYTMVSHSIFLFFFQLASA